MKKYQRYQIYCDLDGVLTDFENYYIDCFGVQAKDLPEDKRWEKVNKIPDWWLRMPWVKDGKVLWNYIEKYNSILLTTPAYSVRECKQNKLDWVAKELGDYKVIFSSYKYKHAKFNHILIDDFEDNILKWREYFGVGILHKNSKQTIKELQKLGL